MAQNIYDDPDFFAGYSRLPRQVLGHDGAPEWPTLRAMLPDLAGRRVLDLGCGFGWFARWARAEGAASVLGIDLSEKMIARARHDTSDPAVRYAITDLELLYLPAGEFDLAYSSLALHYVADFARLAGVVHRALAPGSAFVFSIEHPIFMAAPDARWQADADGRRIWPVRRYAVEGERRSDWLAPGVLKHHRTVATTLNDLMDAGFAIRRVAEFAPTAAQIAAEPALEEELDRPMMLMVAASR